MNVEVGLLGLHPPSFVLLIGLTKAAVKPWLHVKFKKKSFAKGFIKMLMFYLTCNHA